MSRSEDGLVDPRFEPVVRLFTSLLDQDRSVSAQLVVWHGGERVIDLARGPHMTNSTLTGVYSASKGIAGTVIARLLDEQLLELDAPVALYWPDFAAAGKADCTVGDLLAHRVGLPISDRRLSIAELTRVTAAAQLASQSPLWRPGSAFGYHAVTIGILMEELVRRVAHTSLQDFYERNIRRPLDADFYLGLPESEDHRYLPVVEVHPTTDQTAEIAARPPADAMATAVFDNVEVPPEYAHGPGLSTNIPELRRSGPAAIGGVGSAAGLAAVYAATLRTWPDPIATEQTFAKMATQRSWGTDRVLNVPNSFGTVFMLPQPRMPYAGIGAYGHDGAGGALAFADPTTQVAFAYIPTPMQYPGGADGRSVQLARLVHSIATAL